MRQERRIANTNGIYSLWINWLVSIGSLVAVPIVSLYVSKIWLPFLVFILEIFLYIIVRFNKESKMPSCMKLPHIAMVSLFWSTIVMMIINIFYHQSLFDIIYLKHSVNKDIPYIPILIIAPITSFVTLKNILKANKSGICIDCQARNGSISERGFLGKIFNQEGEFLSRMLLMFSIIISVICWIYYFLFYINASINNFDKFIFIWSQVIIYAFTLIYLGIRYFSLWLYYCQNIEGQSLRYNSSSLLRYIIVCDDYIFLNKPDSRVDNVLSDEVKIDTPARLYIQYKKDVSINDSMLYLDGLSGIKNAELRFLYKNTNFNTECNIFHYAYFVENKLIVDNSRLEGDWYSLPQIKTLIKENKVSAFFVSEIERVYKITMAWKTYNRKGYRLYNIKNYKPTFRIRDIKDWDVDYNDIRWIFISENNEDCYFFKLRNFFNRYICGISIVK